MNDNPSALKRTAGENASVKSVTEVEKYKIRQHVSVLQRDQAHVGRNGDIHKIFCVAKC